MDIVTGAVAFLVGGLFGLIVTAVLAADHSTEDGAYRRGYDDGYQAGRLDEREDEGNEVRG